MSKKIASIVVVLLIVIGLFYGKSLFNTSEQIQESASNNVTKTPSIEPHQTALSVTDYTGNTLTFDKPVKSIIALAPHIVENVYSAGAGDLLVAAVAYSNYPEAANSLPKVGSYNFINYEEITVLNPDLIIAWESGHNKGSIDRLTELGFKVYIDHPKKLEDVAKSIQDIGLLTQREQAAKQTSDKFLAQLKDLKSRYADQSKVSLFYQVWSQPLQTINGTHIISDALSVCGGTNIYADEIALAPVINIESILERDPQAIIASGMADARPDWLNDWVKWPKLTAVKQDNLLFVHPDLIQRHTVRILLGIENICEQLMAVRNKPQVNN